ncbi:MAG: hypothetical protein CBC29_06355 [Methylococcaceae bacterium TMED69]|nr:MAG: hypothetical protein CBC29_06355 [Methylococcaceae bacterium TMED69]|tara:strand:+ start:1380 stop:1727 length:348 start_codon:yes stop_codon:yes gene_type:complete
MKHFKAIYTKSGWAASIQASATHFSIPRSNSGPWTHVEIAFPSAEEPLIKEFAEDWYKPLDTVYGYVPAGIIAAIIIKHGGIKSGELPELCMNVEQSAILAETLIKIEKEKNCDL